MWFFISLLFSSFMFLSNLFIEYRFRLSLRSCLVQNLRMKFCYPLYLQMIYQVRNSTHQISPIPWQLRLCNCMYPYRPIMLFSFGMWQFTYSKKYPRDFCLIFYHSWFAHVHLRDWHKCESSISDICRILLWYGTENLLQFRSFVFIFEIAEYCWFGCCAISARK